ncbi:ricin B lectin domain-containing protein [Mycena galopus ATCC 62051]|nr:ricin B lectin domain-containing protein [Mycena galopus ATCC 62051]
MPIFQGVLLTTLRYNYQPQVPDSARSGRREQRKRCGVCIRFLCFPPILNRGTFAGTKVQGWEALPANHILLPDQLWKVQYTGKPGIDSYTISNLKSGTYLENKGGNVNNGAPFTSSRWAVAGGQTTTDQEWELIKTSANGYYKIRNVASQTYLDLDSGSSKNGTKVQSWQGQDGNENQLWAFNPVNPPPA